MRFAVHPLWRPRASPRSHGVSRRDIPGRIRVSVAREAAGIAGEERLALATLRCDVPAPRAALACEGGIDPFYSARGLFLQTPNQQTPAGSHNLAIQSGLLADVPARCLGGSFGRTRHVADLEVLNPDHVEPPCQIRADLFSPILPRIRFLGLEASDGHLDAGAATRAALGPRQLALKLAEPALLSRLKPRHGEQLPRGQRSRDSYATVDADYLARARHWNRLRNCGECDVPAARPVLSHSVRLRRRNGAGPSEPYPSRLRYPDLAYPPAQLLDLLRPERNDPKSLIAARFAPRRLTVGAGEEACHRLSEVPQGLLLHHLATRAKPDVFGASGGELTALLHPAGRVATAGPPPGLLFDCEIPYIPGVRTVIPQNAFLGGRRVQPVTRHANTLASATDIPREAKRRCLSGLAEVGASGT